MQPKTIEVVIYDDGTAAVSEFDRDRDGRQTYVGRVFLDAAQTAHVVGALDEVDAIGTPGWLTEVRP